MKASELQRRVASTRRRGTVCGISAAACRWLAGLAATAGVCFLLDWLLIGRFVEDDLADVCWRVVVLLGALGVLAATLRRTVWRALAGRADADDVALALEDRYPALGGGLIATLQFRRARDAGVYVGSPELVAVVAEQTLARSAPLDFGAVTETAPLWRSAAVLCALLAATGALGAWQAERAAVFARRMALGDERYPTAARLLSVTAAQKIPVGEPLVVEAVVDPGGVVPASASLQLRATASGTRLSLPMHAAPGPAANRFRAEVAAVMEELTFRVVAHDARSRWRRVAVVQRPAVTGLELTYHYPRYTRRPAQTARQGDIRALIGTRVALAARTSKPVRTARLVILSGGRQVAARDLAVGDGGTCATGEMEIADNGVWRILLTDADGFGDRTPAQWTIEALPDQPPTVAVRFPAADKVVTPKARWPVVFAASDDWGLGEATLKWQVAGVYGAGMSAEQAKALGTLDPDGTRRRAVARTVVDLSALGAQPGQQVHYWLEVADHKEPSPGKGRSKTFTFDVADAKTVGDTLDGERDAALRQLGLIVQEEDASRTKVDTIRRSLRRDRKDAPE